MGTSQEGYCKFMLSHFIPLWVRNVVEESCRENQNTYFMFNKFVPKIVLSKR